MFFAHCCVDSKAFLQDNLEAMNRRLRRRMVTRGDVSLDVEDNRGPHEWPQVSHVTMDMLKYSVHLPLQPEVITWSDNMECWCLCERVAPFTSTQRVRAYELAASINPSISAPEKFLHFSASSGNRSKHPAVSRFALRIPCV